MAVTRLISATGDDIEKMSPMELKESILRSEGRVVMGQHLLFAGSGLVRGGHDDEAVAGDFPEDFHYLNRGLAVQRAGRFVGEDDVGVVDDGAGDCDPLHLTAGHFRGLFLKLVAEADALQGFCGSSAPFGLFDAGEREGELDVGEYGLV